MAQLNFYCEIVLIFSAGAGKKIPAQRAGILAKIFKKFFEHFLKSVTHTTS